MKKILVLAPHADDEVLGCAGVIQRARDSGDSVAGLCFCSSPHTQGFPSDFHKAIKFLHPNATARCMNFIDNRLDLVSIASLARIIEEAISEFNITDVYAPKPTDTNQDHRKVAEAAAVATRPLGGTVERFFGYNVPGSSTGWGAVSKDNYFVSLTNDQMRAKVDAMRQFYASELRSWPHPRSVKAIVLEAARSASLNGISGSIESFELIREIVK